MTTLLIVALLAIIALGLAVGLPLLDRYCLALAERRSGEFLAVPLGRPAVVRIHGRSFLTQALRGRYRSVHVTGGGLRIGEMTGAALDAQLSNVYVSLGDLIRRRVTELPCEHLEGRLVLPYGELARVVNVPGLELRPSGDRVLATAALPVPGISQLARVNGRAVLTLGEGNTVWLRVRGVSVAGISLPTVVLNQLLPSLDVPIPLPPLPYGLRIEEVRPGEDGLVVLGSAAAVVFRRLATSGGAGATVSAVTADRPRPTIRDARPEL